MKTMKMYDYQCLDEIRPDEKCIINIGLAYYLLGSVDALYCFKEQHPQAMILMDLRILGEEDVLDAKIAYDAGADIVSISGLADEKTMADAAEIAEANGGHLLMDLKGVLDVDARLEDADLFGIEYASMPAGMSCQSGHYAALCSYADRRSSYLNRLESRPECI